MANGRLEISIRHHGVLKVVYTQVKYNVQVRTLNKKTTYLEFKNMTLKTYSGKIRGYVKNSIKTEIKHV